MEKQVIPDELKTELKSVIDDGMKDSLETQLGPAVASEVEKKVGELRLERALGGSDLTGLSQSEKADFAKEVKSVAFGRVPERSEKAAYLSEEDASGGYLVPTEVHNGIIRIAETTGIIARDARKWPMASDTLEIPRYTGSVMKGEYIGQDEEAGETQNDLGVARLQVAQWMNIFRVSEAMLQDAGADFTDWLMAMAAEGFSYNLDEQAFMAGTGTSGVNNAGFTGLLASSDVTEQTMASGKTGFDDFDPLEAAVAIGGIQTSALNDSAFYMHRTVWAQLKGKQDATSGEYLFRQDNSPLVTMMKENGISPVGMIQGYPVYTTDVLPAYSASAVSTKFAVFGNLKLAVAWGDRGPMGIAQSTDATVGGKSLFRTKQRAIRFDHRHAMTLGLPAAAVVLKTAAS